MRAPEFWRHRDGRESAPLLRMLLWPAARIYGAVHRAKMRSARPVSIACPAICVGNISLGGTGKTPVVRALAADLRAQGLEVHTLARGYGGSLKGPLCVNLGEHDARAVGDEAMLHAQSGPHWIARHRGLGALAARMAGAQCIILDDGMQNAQIRPDRTILVIDADYGFGSERLFPMGPLRERFADVVGRLDAIVIVQTEPGRQFRPDGLEMFTGPIFDAILAPVQAAPAGRILAFAGIGMPEKFLATLRLHDADLADFVPFPDHHPYRRQELDHLIKRAAASGATLLTTEKDWVRLPRDYQAQILAFRVELRFEAPEAWRAFVTDNLLRLCRP